MTKVCQPRHSCLLFGALVTASKTSRFAMASHRTFGRGMVQAPLLTPLDLPPSVRSFCPEIGTHGDAGKTSQQALERPFDRLLEDTACAVAATVPEERHRHPGSGSVIVRQMGGNGFTHAVWTLYAEADASQTLPLALSTSHWTAVVLFGSAKATDDDGGVCLNLTPSAGPSWFVAQIALQPGQVCLVPPSLAASHRVSWRPLAGSRLLLTLAQHAL
jgi:hypothetical protein